MRSPLPPLLLPVLGLAVFSAAPLRGQSTVYWDGDGSGTQAGGTGTWNTTLARWSSTSGGSTFAPWSAGNIATFDGTAGTVTLDSAVTTGGLTFGTTGYTLGGSSTLTLNGNGVVNTNNFTATISAPIAGTTLLRKSGGGTLVLAGTNTTAGLQIDNGIVSYASPANLGTGSITMNGGASTSQLRYTGAGSITLANSIAVANVQNILAVTQNGASITYSGTIAGTGGVTFSNSGTTSTTTLSGNNTYSGGTVFITYGKVIMGHANAFGTGALNLNTAYLDSGGVDRTLSNSLTLGLVDLTGRFTFTGNATIGSGGATIANTQGTTFSGVISGTGQLETTSVPGITLTGNNTWTGGLKISSSTVTFSTNANLGADANAITLNGILTRNGSAADLTFTHALNVIGGSFNDYAGGKITMTGALSGSGSLNLTASDFVLAAAGTYSGALTFGGGQLTFARDDVLGTGSLRVGGATLAASGGARTLSNAVTFLSSTQFAAGTLALNGSTTLGGASLQLTTQTGANVTLGGNIGQSASGYGFTKLGDGTLTLTGANTFSGNVALNAGTTRIGNSSGSAFGTGNVTVAADATLTGAGSFSGTLLLEGELSPGNSPGTLTAGATTFASGASYRWEINDAAGAAGTAWDLLSVNGGLTITATAGNPFTIFLTSLTAGNAAGVVANFDPAQSTFYTFVTTTGGITGFDASRFVLDTSAFANAFDGSWSIAQSGNDLNLVYTASAIPEPSTYAALVGALALGVALVRRRRQAEATPANTR
jgi:autotransporter-associated beta strand protein